MINLRRREDNKRTSVVIEILYPKIAKREDEERSATAPKLDVPVEKISVLHLLEISWLTWSLMLKTFDL